MSETMRLSAHQLTSVDLMLKQEFLEPLGLTQAELAKAMGVSRKTVNGLCDNRLGVSSETAFLLARALGTTPAFWRNLQRLNEAWHGKASASKWGRWGRRVALSPVADCAEALTLLRAHQPTVIREFAVEALALFGSLARDEASAGSDVDILVIFDGPATSARYFGLQFYLEDVLGRSVNLVIDKALRPELRACVEAEAVYV